MNVNLEATRIEVLFNSVETELARRWIDHDVPAHFAHRPVAHLRRIVKAWWHIYHESNCAGQALDRTSGSANRITRQGPWIHRH